MEDTMKKVLVIDDKEINRVAALAQLKDQNLTVCSNYDEALELVKEGHDFEIVLVDLFLPASDRAQGPKGKKFVGQEMPIGIFLALLAAKNGAQYVAVFTDTGHHDHPISACFDMFPLRDGAIRVNNTKFYLCNNPNWIGVFSLENLAEEMEWAGELDPKKCTTAKNWRKLFDFVISRT
jgi:CheY-like chemotaxis protein